MQDGVSEEKSADSKILALVPEIPVPEIPVPEIPVPEIPVPEIPEPEIELVNDSVSKPAVTAEEAAARKELLRLAMKAFRKRLKLTILDDESRLGRGPMSGGSKSSVIAITPPNQFARDVWEELAEQGKIKRAGRGVYELTE